MSYTVLARRYRAASFGEVIGQEPIAQTLKNAIAQARVGHAYLFTGTRGVGKTSMARIFAAALNAPATVEDSPQPPDDDPDAYPPTDVQQRMAEAIRRGDDLNVIEIDGASNNSVDQARQLIANAGLSPSAGARYKVYIIDEVHMLSSAAFNALLKTMEEPPSHVKFILCTTEPHKVPPTIQSRCQRFDFRSIPTAKIAEHLRAITERESLTADEQVAWRVARLGNGSMRDALSLMDRMIAGADETGDGHANLDVSQLERLLGLPSEELVIRLVDAFADGNPAAALDQVAHVLAGGISQDQLISVLIERLRELMLVAACGRDSELVELSDEALDRAAEQSNRFDTAGLVHMIALCENLQRNAKSSANARALLDATVVRLALAEKMADVATLLAGQPQPPSNSKKKLSPPAPASPPARNPHNPATPIVPVPAATPQTAPAAKEAIPSDRTEDVWTAVIQRVQDKPAVASWLNKLKLTGIDGRVARVVCLPGQRDILAFVDERRRSQLAELIASVVNRPVEVSVTTDDTSLVPERGGSGSPNPNGSGAARPSTAAADRAAGPSARSANFDRRPTLDEASKREAMKLPMVRNVIEVLDATLVDIVRADDAKPVPE